jgi:hypothetical protein
MNGKSGTEKMTQGKMSQIKMEEVKKYIKKSTDKMPPCTWVRLCYVRLK